MLEFARQQWLWLFALVAVFYVAWWFARRYRKQRVTYGRIWERVARRVLPPGWKRILRTVLTLLISGLMLGSVVLYAAGLQRPAAEQPPPALVVIVLDNSPSMRATHDGTSRAEQSAARAQEIVDALNDDDRALIAWFKDGHPLLGRWLKRGDVVGPPPPTDFAPADTAALNAAIDSLPPPPDVPALPVPRRLQFWLGDAPPDDAPGIIEAFGVAAANNGIVNAHYTPPGPQDAHAGILDVSTLGGPARLFDTLGRELAVLQGPTELPAGTEFRLAVAPDALPMDDAAGLTLAPRGVQRVVLCYPATDGEANPLLRETLELLLPGREVETRAVPADGTVTADLLIMDRALPADFDARFLMCFGVIPPRFGRVGDAVSAEPNMQLRVPTPEGLGFEPPDLSLLTAREARPLLEGHTLTPLALHLEGGALVAATREVLYSGFLPHQSNLLWDSSGFLLLLRWVHALQTDAGPAFPPFVQAGAVADFQLDAPAELRLEAAPGNPWLPAYGPRAYTLVTGPDGRGEIGPIVIPGEYIVLKEGREIARTTALWAAPGLPVLDAPAFDLAALFTRSREPDWRDLLPGLLLWIALGLLVIEWLFWLLGITE